MKPMTERRARNLGHFIDTQHARVCRMLGVDREEALKDPLMTIATARAELELFYATEGGDHAEPT